MDGTLEDRIGNGRLLRLATYTYAQEAFPRFIVRLRLGLLTVDSANSPETKQIITISSPDRADFLMIRKEDFDICCDIAGGLQVVLFASDRVEDLEQRALAQVKLRFKNRPI